MKERKPSTDEVKRPCCSIKGCDREGLYVLSERSFTNDCVYLCEVHMRPDIGRYCDADEDIMGCYPWDLETGDSVRMIAHLSDDERNRWEIGRYPHRQRTLMKLSMNSVYGKGKSDAEDVSEARRHP